MPVLSRQVAETGRPVVMTSVWGQTHLNVGWFDDVDATLDLAAAAERGVAVIRRPLYGGGTAFYVHDLIPIEYPEYVRPGEKAQHEARMETVLALGATIIVNSDATRRSLEGWAERQGRARPVVHVARIGVEPGFRVSATAGPPIRMMPNAKAETSNTAIVTWPVNVWFGGSKTFVATLDFGARPIRRITLDPFGRFPDKNPADNVWPK